MLPVFLRFFFFCLRHPFSRFREKGMIRNQIINLSQQEFLLHALIRILLILIGLGGSGDGTEGLSHTRQMLNN